MQRLAVSQALLGVCVFFVLPASAHEVFRPEDAADLKSLLLSEAGPSGNFGGSLEDAQYGVGALILLGAKDELQMKPLCSLAAAKLSSAEATVTEAWQAADVGNSCRCSDGSLKAKAEKIAKSVLETEVADTQTGYLALGTLASLGKSASPEAIHNALVPIQKLKASKGQLRLVPKGPGSILATAYGYLAIAQAKRVGVIGKNIQHAVEELLADMPQVLEAASKKIPLPDRGSVLEVAARLIQGMAATCSEDCNLDVHQLGALAKLLTRAKAVGSVEDACHVLAGLTILSTSGNLPKPVALELEAPGAPLAKADVVVLALDFLGNPATVASMKGNLKGHGMAATKDLSFAAEEAGAFKASLQGLGLTLGTYQVVVTAHGEGGKLASEILSLTLTGKVDIGAATVSVKNLETSSEKQQGQLEYPDSLKAPIPLGPRNQLKVAFSIRSPLGKPFTPQQVFMSLKSKAGAGTVLLAAKASKGSVSDYTATATPDTIVKLIGAHGGIFDVELSVGDNALEETVHWSLGSVNVTHAPGAAPALSAALRDSLPKPEIRHIFRTPDRQPPVALSTFFAAAAIAVPFSFLLLRLYQLGVNVKGFPTSKVASTAMIAFHGGLAGILVLYAVFWLRLTLIDTLLPLAGLSMFTFLAGYKALSWHARQDANPIVAKGNGFVQKKD